MPEPSLRRDVIRLAWPLVVQNLLQTLMFFVDTFMLGRVGKEAVAAMGIAGPICHTCTSVLAALSVGTLAVVARAWGEGDREKQDRAAATALSLALMVGAPLSALGATLLPRAAVLFSVPGAPEIAAMARGYLAFEGASFLFLCLHFVASGILRAAGNTRAPMAATLVANVVNIFLNWVFIYGNWGAPRLGVAGSGLATALATVLEGCLTVGFLWTRGSPIRLRNFGQVTRESLAKLLRVTLPAAVEPLILTSGFLVFTKAVTLLGATMMAAHRAAITIESLTFMPGYGFAVAGSALVGQSLGAGRPDRAEAGFRETARLSTYLMSAIGVCFLLFPATLARLFIPGSGDADVVGAAALCLMIAAVEQPFMALAMALGGALRGAGDTKSPLIVAVIGVWCVRVPLSWALAFPLKLGLYGIWITMIADWMVRTIVFSVLWRRGRWKAIKL